jgi:hypothetical protein
MELSDATEETSATPGIDPETFRLVSQCKQRKFVMENRSNSLRALLVEYTIFLSSQDERFPEKIHKNHPAT